MFQSRKAITLLELIVVIAILGIIMGLLLPAIQAVREAARRTESGNNLRQIMLGVHGNASAHGDALPGPIDHAKFSFKDRNPLYESIPFIEQEPSGYIGVINSDDELYASQPIRKTFVSPADPTFALIERTDAPSSYAYNPLGFQGPARLGVSHPDGTSQTIAFCERYCRSPSVSSDKARLAFAVFWRCISLLASTSLRTFVRSSCFSRISFSKRSRASVNSFCAAVRRLKPK